MPNRIIKESIHTSEKLNQLTDFQFRLWVGLLTYVDDYGRGDARPAVIKGLVFPLRDRLSAKDVSDALVTLADTGCVNLYAVDGRPYLYFPTWEVHQNIRAHKSKFPAPEDGIQTHEIFCKQMNSDDCKCPRNPIQSESNPNTNTNTEESAHARTPTPEKHRHGQYGWVQLTDDEHARLIKDLGEAEAERCIRYVDEYAESTGNKFKYKNWNLVVRKCSREKWGVNQQKQQNAGKSTSSSESKFGQYEREAVARLQRKYSSDWSNPEPEELEAIQKLQQRKSSREGEPDDGTQPKRQGRPW